MIKVFLHQSFIKSYAKRAARKPALAAKTQERIKLFKRDCGNAILKDHRLSGAKKGLRSFSVTGDIRIIYRPAGAGEVVFIDIGSHNQVY